MYRNLKFIDMKTLNLFKTNLLKGLFVLALTVYSCNKDIDGFDILDKMSDDALIEAIAKSSEKQEIDYNQLPSSAKTIINEDYETMTADISFKVEDLGYEVKMIDYSPLYVADKNEVYFNKNGRELVSEGKKSEKGKRKKKKSPFKFVFPVSFEMADGSTITANDKQELKSLIKAWRDENPDSKEKPKLVYPVDLEFRGGKIVTVNNEEEMKKLRKKIKERQRSKKPFKFVFPISYLMPDGSTISANDKEELKSLIKSWYDENPDSKEKPKLVYPVDLDFGDGKIVTVNSEEEMKEIKEKLRERASQGQSNNGTKGR